MKIKVVIYFCLLFSSVITNSAVILQYHHVSDSTSPSTSISPLLFEQHLQYLEQNNYNIWSLPRLVKHLKNKQSIPDRVVVITFDDAYQSIHEKAYPILKKRNWPFTIFVATQSIRNNSKTFMNWKQLKEMAENNANLANHTHSHEHLIRFKVDETTKQWRQRITDEIVIAEKIIQQKIGVSEKLLAYPYGEYTLPLKSLINTLGYVAFGQQSGALGVHQDLSSLPRFPMTNTFGELSVFKTKVASLPFQVVSIVPPEHLVVRSDHFNNGLTIRLSPAPIKLTSLACYLSGKGKIKTHSEKLLNELIIKIEAPVNLKSGRSRINCTAPSSDSKNNVRYYWLSHSWIRKQDNGGWYSEF